MQSRGRAGWGVIPASRAASGQRAVPLVLCAGGTQTPGMGQGRAGGFSHGTISGWGQQSQVCLLDAPFALQKTRHCPDFVRTDVVTGSSSAGFMGRCLLLPYTWRRRHCWHPAGVRSLLISACCLPGVSSLLCAIPSLLWLLTCRNESRYCMHCLSRSLEGVNLPTALVEERFHLPGEENGDTKCML